MNCAEKSLVFWVCISSKDFVSGLGPWIVTMDEIKDKIVNGKLNLSVKSMGK